VLHKPIDANALRKSLAELLALSRSDQPELTSH
jgi:hypothetical protein